MNNIIKLKIENLKKQLSGDELVKALEFKMIYEFFYSLKDSREHLREPHKLEKYLENMSFEKEITIQSLITEFSEVLKKFDFLNENLKVLTKISLEVLQEFLKIDGFFQQKIDRGQFLEISLEIIETINNFQNSKIGNYSTPKEIGELLKNILDVKNNEKCIDVTFGKGNLALRVGNKEIGGYEINSTFVSFGNLMLNIANKDGQTVELNSLSGDSEESDIVVCDPPYSMSSVNLNENKDYLKWGIPNRTTDLHFLSLAIDKSKNRGAIILPEGALFRGGIEGDVRSNIVKSEFIEGVISLPGNLMYHTGIQTSLIIFNKTKKNKKIFFLDAKEKFKKIRGGVIISKDGLQDLARIYKEFQEIENISKFVSCDEILKNDGVLNIVRYIEPKVYMKSTESIIEEMKVSMDKITKYRDISDKILNKI
ncbi:MAG: N-6 DNA methylase [Cetobacterium sp.]